MIFRQIYDDESFTYTYLIAQQGGGEALITDPVVNKISQYLKLIDELGLKLVFAIDTHIHADHVTGLGDLREQTHCQTVMGEHTQAECLSYKVRDGESLKVGDLTWWPCTHQAIPMTHTASCSKNAIDRGHSVDTRYGAQGFPERYLGCAI